MTVPFKPHYGRPGTRVIPEQWAGRHAPVADATHSAVVTLRRKPTHPAFDFAARSSSPVQGAAYAPRVHATITAEDNRTDDRLVGEERVEEPRYRVGVSNHHPCVEDDVVEVLRFVDDPLLVGRLLRVEQVVLGSDRFERDLICVLLPRPSATS